MAERRIVRLTVDVLLPTDFAFVDLADIEVVEVGVVGAIDTTLSDLIDAKVQEAIVEVVDA
ncbi:MAG: hypothetical protein ACTHON_18990 [Humibacter sp.]